MSADPSRHIVVVGDSLAGVACALRLAKLRHPVVLLRDERAADPGLWNRESAVSVVAAWRDLFRKTGRPLEAELERRGLCLTPARPVRWLLPSGALEWSSRRGEQAAAMEGLGVSAQWQKLMETASVQWQLLRGWGLEGDEVPDRHGWRMLERASLRRRAAPLGEAAALVEALAWPQDPSRVPTWQVSRLAADRAQGRWWIVDTDGRPHGLGVLAGLLEQRLVTRRVEVRDDVRAERVTASAVETDGGMIPAEAVVDATHPWSGLSPAPRGLRPALVPQVTRVEAPGPSPDVVDAAARAVSYTRVGPDGWEAVRVDHGRAAEDPRAGAAWRGARSWRRRPALLGADGVHRVGAASRGGGEPWAQLLSGALVAYSVHEQLGGASVRPADDRRRR